MGIAKRKVVTYIICDRKTVTNLHMGIGLNFLFVRLTKVCFYSPFAGKSKMCEREVWKAFAHPREIYVDGDGYAYARSTIISFSESSSNIYFEDRRLDEFKQKDKFLLY